MSKGRGVWRISLPLAAMLHWFKRNLRSFGGLGRRRGQFEVVRQTNEESIELQEFIKVLNVGDRIRVLCDDGLLVAEKISETQFELIHSQMMSRLVQ